MKNTSIISGFIALNKRKIISLCAVLLSIVLLVGSPGQPMQAYATGDTAEEEFPMAGEDVVEDETVVAEASVAPEESTATEASTAPATPAASAETATTNNYQSQISKITDEINALKSEQKEILNNIESIKDEKVKHIAVVNNLDQQMNLTQSEISSIQERLNLILLDIEEKETDIEDKQKEYATNREVFLQRSRAMYMYDTSTTLGLVLGADDFSDFLTTTDMLIRVADHDQKLMESLEEERLTLEEQKVELESSQTAAEGDREEAERLKQTLASQRSTAAAAVQDVAALEAEYVANLEANKKKAASMEAEVANIYKQIQLSKNPYAGGKMEWPVQGFYQVSSVYGWRFGGTDFHTGMDITGGGVYGANVLAANDGVVKHINWSHTPGRGYGIYVIIDHGGSITTLYGHLSNIYVAVGQEVKRGEAIGAVGSTGWSTGPHLHFEVREGSQHVNPQPYVQG